MIPHLKFNSGCPDCGISASWSCEGGNHMHISATAKAAYLGWLAAQPKTGANALNTIIATAPHRNLGKVGSGSVNTTA